MSKRKASDSDFKSRQRVRRSAEPNVVLSEVKSSAIDSEHRPDWVSRFTNCRIFRGGKLIEEDLWTRDGIIVDPVCCVSGMLAHTHDGSDEPVLGSGRPYRIHLR